MPKPETSEIANVSRAQRHARRLGIRERCQCNEHRSAALIPVGARHRADQGVVCRNCLAKERWRGSAIADPDRRCTWCSEDHPATPEWHHVYGRATRPDVGCWLCKNCHAVATARQRDAGLSFDAPFSVIDYGINVLRGDAAYLTGAIESKASSRDFRGRAEVNADLADRLARFRAGLTERHPAWLDIPQAKP